MSAQIGSTNGFECLPSPFSKNHIVSPSQDNQEVPDEDLLPPAYHDDGYKLRNPWKNRRAVKDFLRYDLNLDKLNHIHGWLVWAGRPQPARPLHKQRMIGRKIILTEQAGLHLTWSGSRMYIKPLPKYLLDVNFWESHISTDEKLYKSALGFLLSYSWLITYESDFDIASGNDSPRLVPKDLTWRQWQDISKEILERVGVEQSVGGSDAENAHKEQEIRNRLNKRFHYGELRLGRINKIFRFVPTNWSAGINPIRGYYLTYHEYGSFFSQNFAWLIIVFAYFSIILGAMQLGLATDELSGDSSFMSASYGFSVFAIFLTVIVVAFMLFMLVILVIFNGYATYKAHVKQRNNTAADAVAVKGVKETKERFEIDALGKTGPSDLEMGVTGSVNSSYSTT